MKILTLQGSPRPKGNTASILQDIETRLLKSHEIKRINISELAIKGCLGCLTCQTHVKGVVCCQEDDALIVLKEIQSANVVIYATPLYCWSFSAQLKALLDRQLYLFKGVFTREKVSLIQGKQMALLVTCGGSAEASADLIPTLFDRITHFCQCTNLGTYTVPFCTESEELPKQTTDIAVALARDIQALASNQG